MSEQHRFTIDDTSACTNSISSQLFRSFSDHEYREAYAEEYLTTAVPMQIRAIREQRDWTQEELGKKCGKAQGWISKLEDPNYGKFTLTTLRALAHAFDCILEVRFKSFRMHSDEQEARRPGDLRVNEYAEDAAAVAAVHAPGSDREHDHSETEVAIPLTGDDFSSARNKEIRLIAESNPRQMSLRFANLQLVHGSTDADCMVVVRSRSLTHQVPISALETTAHGYVTAQR